MSEFPCYKWYFTVQIFLRLIKDWNMSSDWANIMFLSLHHKYNSTLICTSSELNLCQCECDIGKRQVQRSTFGSLLTNGKVQSTNPDSFWSPNSLAIHFCTWCARKVHVILFYIENHKAVSLRSALCVKLECFCNTWIGKKDNKASNSIICWIICTSSLLNVEFISSMQIRLYV